jgi:transposase
MNAVGIDISKGKSMVCIMRPFGEVVASPFEVHHTANDLKNLVKFLNGLSGEIRVVMEHTGNYYLPIAKHLHEAGFHVSVVNALLVHDFGQNSLRRVKTDKKDAVKLALYHSFQIYDTLVTPYYKRAFIRSVLYPLIFLPSTTL